MASIQEKRSTLKEFFAGDLSNITAPPFVLATQSTVEFPSYWAERPAVFCAPATSEDPATRALFVLKWFISALKGQQYAGRDPSQGIKKPLNAFLGEIFLAQWDDKVGTTKLVSEQVSHHPPVTACCLWNEEHGVKAEGYTRQEITASLSGSVSIKQTGHAILHVEKFKEDYLVPVPNVKVKGILMGVAYPELSGTHYIYSSSGFHSKIDFTGRGFFSGKRNSFHAQVFQKDEPSMVIFDMEGQWTESFTIKNSVTKTEVETYDAHIADKTALKAPPPEQQDPWESRRAWKSVIDALNRGDMHTTATEKTKLETAQRALRKREESEGKGWKTLFFKNQQDDEVFEALVQGTDVQLHADKTMGVWKFDWDVYNDSKRPFRGGTTPIG